MADFGKVNPEKAQQIISALRDGKINDKEMKELGLTKAEQQALNEAFSSGEVQIGDFILVNKGQGKNAKGQTVQYSETKKAAPQEEAQEKPGFFARAWNRVKRDVSSYGDNFTKAWNESDGFLETAGNLLGATTKTVSDMAKNNAQYVEKGVADITGSETAGKVASRALGIGLIADAANAVEDIGDWSADKIREAAKGYDGTEKALLESFADFVDDMNIADIALLFAGGTGAAKGFKELPKVLELLKGVKAAKVATVATGVAVTASTTSCTTNIYQGVTIDTSGIASALGMQTEAFLKAMAELKVDINTLIAQNESMADVLKAILTQITSTNTLLNDIRNDMNKNDTEILKAILDLQADISALTNLVANLPGDIKNELKGDLDAILKAIKEGNASLASIQVNIENLAAKLDDILDQLEFNGKTQEQIRDILRQIRLGQVSDSQKLLMMIDLLKSIKTDTNNISDKLDVVINLVKEEFKNDKKIEAALNAILAAVQNNGAKQDITNNMLNTLIEMMKNGVSKDDIKAIIEAISKNTDKIEETNKLIQELKTLSVELQKEILDYIANVGLEMNKNFELLINAVKSGNVNMDEIKALLKSMNENIQKNGEDAKALGNQLLEYIAALGFKMDSNYTALINAVKEGNADIKDIKALLESLTKLVQKGNDDAKALGDTIIAYLVEHNGQMAAKFDTIIDVLNDLKAGQGNISVNIQDFLEKVLNNQNSNTEKIINAMAKIKVEGNKVDLSSVEAMLAELIKLVGANGKQLSDINAKLDVINITIESAKDEILKHLKAGNATTTAILNALNEFKNISNENDQKILAKMDTITNLLVNIKNSKYDDTKLMEKLDDILAAIKDHDVKIDVTGKVTCECNCGNGTQHEGILGDLNDLLG